MISSASAAVAAVPHRWMLAASSRVATRPRRYTGWSSTASTRSTGACSAIHGLPWQRQPGGDRGAVLAAAYFDVPADLVGAVPHRGQPGAVGPVGGAAAAVVLNPQFQPRVLHAEADVGVSGARVPRHVCHRFGPDVPRRDLDRGR